MTRCDMHASACTDANGLAELRGLHWFQVAGSLADAANRSRITANPRKAAWQQQDRGIADKSRN